MGKINFEEIDDFLEKYYQEGNFEKYEEMFCFKFEKLIEIFQKGTFSEVPFEILEALVKMIVFENDGFYSLGELSNELKEVYETEVGNIEYFENKEVFENNEI